MHRLSLPIAVLSIAGCAGIGLCQQGANPTAAVTLGQIEQGVEWLLNTERSSADQEQVQPNSALAGAARAHSESMRDEGYVSSQSPDQQGPADRYPAALGQTPAVLVECVLKLEGLGLTAAASGRIHYTLMTNPDYRAALALRDVNAAGVGCASDDSGTIWTTVAFAQLAKAEAAAEPAVTPEEAVAAAAAAAAGAAGAAAGGAAAAGSGTATGGAAGGLATAPVRTSIRRATVASGERLVVNVPVAAGQWVAAKVTVPAGAAVVATACAPDAPDTPVTLAQGESGVAGRDELTLHAARPLHSSGDYEVRIDSVEDVDVRVLVIAGARQAVQLYGTAARAATPIAWGETLAGSLGDSGGTESFRFTVDADQAGTLCIAPLDARFGGAVSLYGPTDGKVLGASLQPGAPQWSVPLQGLAPGEYTVVLVDPDARPASGDFEITLKPEGATAAGG